MSHEPKRARVIAVLNQKGGAGKSTLAANLAAAWAAQPFEQDVLVVDLDAQRNVSTMLGVQPEREAATLYDVFTGDRGLAEVTVVDTVNVRGTGRVDLVPGDARLKDLEATLIVRERREEFLAEYLAGELDRYGIVLVDCPPNLGTLTVNAIFAADEAMIPVAMNDIHAYGGAADLLGTLARLGERRIDIDVACLVRNEVDQRRNAYATLNESLDKLGAPIARTQIPRRAAIEDGAIMGVPVAASHPDSAAGTAFFRLAEEFERPAVTSAKTKVAA